MAKKYRDKQEREHTIIIHTHEGPDSERPVVYSQGNPINGRWGAYNTFPIGHEDCWLEEVPEELIGVGYSWTKNGRLFKVVHEAPTGKAYLVVTENKDQTQSLAWGSVDHWYTEYWWKESDIRQASQT